MSSTLGGPAPATPLLGAVGFGVLLEAMPDALVGVDRAGVICLCQSAGGGALWL